MQELKIEIPDNQLLSAAQKIFQDIADIAAEIKTGGQVGKGSFMAAYAATIEGPFEETSRVTDSTQDEISTEEKTNLASPPSVPKKSLAVVKLKMVDNLPDDKEQRAIARQEASRQLLAKKNIRSPFLDWDLYVAKDKKTRIAARAETDLVHHIIQLLKSKNTIGAERIKQIIGQLVLGLEELHRHGIGHRDIKPANILMVGQTIKITDFEFCAAVINTEGHVANTTKPVGSLPYLAPEIVRLNKVDGKIVGGDWRLNWTQQDHFKADIYALGVTIYQIAAVADPTQKSHLAPLKKSLTEHNPNYRLTIGAIKQQPYFGLTLEERKKFFSDLQQTHAKEVYSSKDSIPHSLESKDDDKRAYLLTPHLEPGDPFNIIPAHIQILSHAFEKLVNQYQSLLVLQQEVHRKEHISRLEPCFKSFASKIDQFLENFPADLSSYDPYSAPLQAMQTWAKQHLSAQPSLYATGLFKAKVLSEIAKEGTKTEAKIAEPLSVLFSVPNDQKLPALKEAISELELQVHIGPFNEGNPQKDLLLRYVRQARIYQENLPPEYLPQLTELTYRVLFHAIDPEKAENNQAITQLAASLPPDTNNAHTLGYISLVILGGEPAAAVSRITSSKGEEKASKAEKLNRAIIELEVYIQQLDEKNLSTEFLKNYIKQVKEAKSGLQEKDLQALIDLTYSILFHEIDPTNLTNTQTSLLLAISDISNRAHSEICYNALAILSTDATTAVSILVNRGNENYSTDDEKRGGLQRALDELAAYITLLNDDHPQKQILQTYFAQAAEDKKSMPVENLPNLTRLTYRVLFHAIDPSNEKNTQAGAALALDIAKLNKKGCAGHIGLVILGAALVAAAVLILLASGGIAAPLAAVLGLVFAKVTVATITSAIAVTAVTTTVAAGILKGGLIVASVWTLRKGLLLGEKSIAALRSTEDSAAARYMIHCGFFAPTKILPPPVVAAVKSVPGTLLSDVASSTMTRPEG